MLTGDPESVVLTCESVKSQNPVPWAQPQSFGIPNHLTAMLIREHASFTSHQLHSHFGISFHVNRRKQALGILDVVGGAASQGQSCKEDGSEMVEIRSLDRFENAL